MALDVGIKSSQVSPKFLHSNATSHTWPFSAIAELIDNAYDPDVSASEIWIDKRKIGKDECLTFVDNGNGMNEAKLYKMLSFGYCEKEAVGNVKPIGYYGNGFKSGSMRLGSDAMVFTRSLVSTSVGFLSQTYLQAIHAEAVVVPIVTWSINNNVMVGKMGSNFDVNMKAILQYSPFKTEKDLIAELKSLEKMKTGTSIIIHNLRRDSTGNLELDLSSDPLDIRNPETPVIDLTSINRPIYTMSAEYRRSLREYCSILYLKPRMKIVLRGQKVKSKLISKSLSRTEVDVYKPTWLDKPIKLTFGFSNRKEPDSCGLMMYHKNRLILAYEKIGCQKQANDHGIGVIGVVEADFLEPIHNKQDFNKTAKYVTFMHNAAGKLNDYYYEKTKNENPGGAKPTSQENLPDWTWAQCDNCLSWRRLPTGYNEKLPDKWFCYLNPDAAFNRCDIPEEPEDEDEALQPTYRKTYKKTLAEKNRLAKLEETRKLKEKEEALRRKEKMIQNKLKEISRKEEVLEEVSSSQDRVDRKPTIADLERAKKSLHIYQEKLVAQERTIKQLENQKKQIEDNSKAMIHMAESLSMTNLTSKNLVEKVKAMAGTSNSTVSSSSTSLRAPVKRKSTTEDGSNKKMTKIKTEDGGFINIHSVISDDTVVDLTVEEEDMGAFSSSETDVNDPDVHENDDVSKSTPDESENTLDIPEQNNSDKTSTGNKTNKVKGRTSATSLVSVKQKKCVKNATNNEIASEKDSEHSDQRTEAKENEDAHETMDTDKDKYTELTEEDVKPDKNKLDEDLTGSKACSSKDLEEKVLIPKGVQTVPTVIKFASPEEVDLLTLCPLEQTQMMLQKSRELDETKKNLTETKTALKSLQENIWQLLKIIVEDFDYGDPENIETVILDFIRVNGEQHDHPSTSGQ